MLNINEYSFKRVMSKIGLAMLIFLGLYNVLSFLLAIVFEFINESLTSEVIYELLSALFYLVSFITPAIFLNKLAGEDNSDTVLQKKVPTDIVAYIFASISVVLIVSYINFIIVNSFGYSDFSSEFIWGNEPLSNYQIVLMFITTAIVPAFAEEFLFRGAILSALKPYGKAPAIFISAILFAFMHQNIEQLLYTFAAGLVLAWVVYETGSIWSGVLIHFFNNLLSVISTPILDRLPETTSGIVLFIIEFCIFTFGIISAIYLFVKKIKRNKNKIFRSNAGIYGVPSDKLETDDHIIKRHVRPSRIIKDFFSPTVVTFLVISIISMIYYIIASLLYNAGAL